MVNGYIGSEHDDLAARNRGKPQNHTVSAAGFGHSRQPSVLRQQRNLPVRGWRAEIDRAWQILPMTRRNDIT
jgi:hypothetical protein